MKVLAYTSPARGHLYPVVPIVQELQRRGHELALLTLSSQVETVRALGIDAGPISGQVEAVELDDYKAHWVPAKGRRALATFAARAEHEAPDLARAIDAHHPDVLVIDVNCWGAATVAEASGLPWAVYCPYLLMLPSRDAPAYGPGLPPPGGPLGRARDVLLRRLGNVGFDRAVLPALDALRARHGLGGFDHFTDLLEQPPLLLALTAEGFEYPRSDWPANVRLVGAINWDPPTPRRRGWPRCPTRWCSSRARPSTSTTGAWSGSHWRRCPRPACRYSPLRPRTTPTRSTRRRGAGSCASSPTKRSWSARRA